MKDILDHINLQIERNINNAQKTGVTIWALLVGITYILIKLIPIIFDNMNAVFIQNTALYFILSYCVFTSLKASIKIKQGGMSNFQTKVTNFKHEIDHLSDLIIPATISLLFFIIATVSALKIENLPIIIILLTSTPLILYGSIFTLLGLFIASLKFVKEDFFDSYHIKSSLTKISFFLQENGYSFCCRVFFLLFSISCLLALIGMVPKIPSDISEELFFCVFYINILLFLSDKIIELVLDKTKKYIFLLQELEREIILNNMDEDSAKIKLKEIYGFPFKEWLAQQTEDLQRVKENFINVIEHTPELIKELKNINPQYAHEINQRKQNFLAELRQAHNNYSDLHINLKVYLCSRKSKLLLTETEQSIVVNRLDTMEKEYKETYEQFNIRMDELERSI